ncbi:hypothetical protein [Actinomyces gerencseriae]|uniref:hypothetical protein n=1 Tax=Actinomyces gerencseriae TaxID=52769 RepID=UPI0028F00403|nr:hypothetical protein [Actinomyces gerencseriae]
MKHATGLSVHRFARPSQRVGQSEPRHTVPVVLGVGGSLRAALVYLRHNPPQAAIDELLGVAQSTVSRTSRP